MGARLREFREALGITQADAAAVVGTKRAGTISGWETTGTPDLGGLRLLADLCANDREVFAWLRDGGERPQFLRLLPGARPEAAWEGERKEVARRLRQLAEELDPTPSEPAGRIAAAAAAAGPSAAPAPPRHRASGA